MLLFNAFSNERAWVTSSHKSIEDIDKEIAELSEAIEQFENGSWKIETQKMGGPRIDMSKFQAE